MRSLVTNFTSLATKFHILGDLLLLFVPVSKQVSIVYVNLSSFELEIKTDKTPNESMLKCYYGWKNKFSLDSVNIFEIISRERGVTL